MSKHNKRRRQFADRQDKRAQFTARRSRGRGWLVIMLVLFFMGVPLTSYLWTGGGAGGDGLSAARTVVPSDGKIRLALADLSAGQAQFYEVGSSGDAIRFFAMKGSDGVYRAALDACEICFSGGKGYFQRGDEMVCRKCSQSFPSALINEATGGCHPIGIPRAVIEDHLVIDARELEAVHAAAAARASQSARAD